MGVTWVRGLPRSQILLDRLQGSFDRYRRPGSRRLQSERDENLRGVPAHSVHVQAGLLQGQVAFID
jgi:hypothetical protein